MATVPAAAEQHRGHGDVQAVIIDGFTADGAPGAMVYAQDRRGRWPVPSGTAEPGTDRVIRPGFVVVNRRLADGDVADVREAETALR